MIHLELLCRHSQKISDLFTHAEELSRSYAKVKSIRKATRSLLPPETPTDVFLGEKVDDMVVKVCRVSFRPYIALIQDNAGHESHY